MLDLRWINLHILTSCNISRVRHTVPLPIVNILGDFPTEKKKSGEKDGFLNGQGEKAKKPERGKILLIFSLYERENSFTRNLPHKLNMKIEIWFGEKDRVKTGPAY
jgi:hypothetical protein